MFSARFRLAASAEHHQIMWLRKTEIAAGELLDHIGIDALGPQQCHAPLQLLALRLQLVALAREPGNVLFIALARFEAVIALERLPRKVTDQRCGDRVQHQAAKDSSESRTRDHAPLMRADPCLDVNAELPVSA